MVFSVFSDGPTRPWGRVARLLSATAILSSTWVVSVAVDDAQPVLALGLGTDVAGPSGSSQQFGEITMVLGNGNYLVSDSGFDGLSANDIGAVSLYDGVTNQIISTLTGTNADDAIGGEIVPIGASDFLVVSDGWDRGTTVDAGAVTWVSGTTGLNGSVKVSNSIVGASDHDGDSMRAFPLTNGNYVVAAMGWDSGGTANAGAARWAKGDGSTTGGINSSNSIHGDSTNDLVATNVTALTDGNYVVQSYHWSSSTAASVGATTWGNGSSGTVGLVAPGNSVVGVTAFDSVGLRVTPLTDGDYVVGSPNWANPNTNKTLAGAATWRAGGSASPAVVDTTTSTFGTHQGDRVGDRVLALTDGNYTVSSPDWSSNTVAGVGAVTWGNGTNGNPRNNINSINSLVGLTENDHVGAFTYALHNGHYVVLSPGFDGAGNDSGAVTWRVGEGSNGPVTSLNSLVGAHDYDGQDETLTVLTNGNYVVDTPNWTKGATGYSVGAITWVDGSTGRSGNIAASTSVVGAQVAQRIGDNGVTALSNGDYVVSSTHIPAAVANAGAVTWFSGSSSSATLTITAANSIVGALPDDLANVQITPFPDGSYVVEAGTVDNGPLVEAGAVVWARGGGSTVETVTSATALLGTHSYDGYNLGVFPLPDSTMIVSDRAFDWEGKQDVGMVMVTSERGLTGTITPANSLIGEVANQGVEWFDDYSGPARYTKSRQIIVTRFATHVTLLGPSEYVALAPTRIADTRLGYTTSDGANAGTGQLGVGATLDLPVIGRGGVRTDAVAVSLNVTATGAVAAGYVTVYPCGSAQPTASNVNFSVGATTPNAVISKVGPAGDVCLFVSNPTDLVVDVDGYIPASSSYAAVNPVRLLETRDGFATTDALQQGGGAVATDSSTTVQIGGRAGLPGDLAAVAVNVTITNPATAGYATVYPCGGTPPTASSLNYTPGSTVANFVLSKVAPNGTICVYSQAAADIIIDVNGYFPAVTGYRPLAPARLLDTRQGQPTIDSLFSGGGALAGGAVSTLPVAGRGGVPAGAGTVVLNVTATNPADAGYITVYPCGIDPPLASNLNYVAGQTIPNAVVVKVGAGGSVCITSSQTTDVIVDVTGYLGN